MVLRLASATLLSLSTLLIAQTPSTSTPPKGQPMPHHTSGSFQPDIKPLPADFPSAPNLGRMTIDKTLHGGIEATSIGQMLTAMTATKGSAGYVAVELVTGTLDGRSGSFALMHTGIMDRGKPSLTITVVPDSGTGQLTGISGVFTVHIAPGGAHTYDFDYTLPETPQP